MSCPRRSTLATTDVWAHSTSEGLVGEESLVAVKLAITMGVKLPGVGPGLYKSGKCSLRPPAPSAFIRKPSTSPA